MYYFVLRGNHTGIVGKHLLTRGTWVVLSSAGISKDVARKTKHENRGNNGSEHVEFVGGIEEM